MLPSGADVQQGDTSQPMLQGDKGTDAAVEANNLCPGTPCHSAGLSSGESGSCTALWRCHGSVVIRGCHCALIASNQVFRGRIKATQWRKTMHRSLISLNG